VGWEKMACWSTKAAISLKRVKIEEKLLWRAYRKRSFEWYHPRPLRPPLPLDWGFAIPPKTAIAIISGTAKARDSNLAGIFAGSIRTQAHEKFWRKGTVGVSRDCPIFGVPPIISGTGKATKFKFGRYIHRIHLNKSPLKFGRKKSVGVSSDFPNCSSTPYYLRST